MLICYNIKHTLLRRETFKMSVAEDLKNLKFRQKNLQEQSNQIRANLAELYKRRDFLKEQIEQLKAKTSQIARRIEKGVKEELCALEDKIEQDEAKKEQKDRKLQEINSAIAERENETSIYIEEQVKRMVQIVLAYIKDYEYDIGRDLRREFSIHAEEAVVQERYGDYNIPTGKIIIHDEKRGPITATCDFYFKQELYTISREPNLEYVIVHQTEWYQKYFENFVQTFLKTLEKQYSNSKELKLTIRESGFTLELV